LRGEVNVGEKARENCHGEQSQIVGAEISGLTNCGKEEWRN